ncbi:MAG: Hsp20/alpha crystallin family protein [Candidatus Hermodarchaeota archaeon]
MSELKEIKRETEIEEKEDKPSKPRVFPEICASTNKEGTGFDIEVYLPGVDKEKIELKMNKDYFKINGELESLTYSGTYQFCCPVDPEKAKSIYKEGLLKINVPYEEAELHTVDVTID